MSAAVFRILWLGLALFLCQACRNEKKEDSVQAAARPGPPNIVLIYADDLGYGDTGAYGASALKTPNIDRLAAEGLRFTNAYASSATCTPSRYALLTGVYPWKKKEARILPGNASMIIDTGQITLPGMLQAAGYRTGIVGKWHLGLGNGPIDWNTRIAPGPNEVGFEYSYILAATQDRVPTVYIRNGEVVGLDPEDPIYVDYQKNFPGEPTATEDPGLLKMDWDHGHNNSVVNGIGRIGFMKGGEAARWKDEDMADTFLAAAQAFIRSQREQPFFLYYALQQPHVPRTPHPRFAGQTGLGPRGDAIFEADWCVGELMKTLREEGLRENTLIIFSSDNGPVLNDGYKDQAVERNGSHSPWGPWRGGKYSLFQAGTRVPFIASWPGRIAPDTSDALFSQVDLLATVAALIAKEDTAQAVESASLSGLDSQDLLDALLGERDTGRESLVLEATGRTAFRSGDWSLIPPYPGPAVSENVNIELGNAPEYRLYHLPSDPGETRNLAGEFPALLRELTEAYEAAIRQ